MMLPMEAFSMKYDIGGMRIGRIAVAASLACVCAASIATRAMAAGDHGRLIAAIKAHDVSSVRALISQHVDVNEPQPDGATALHWAARVDDAALVQLLLSNGARVNAANDYGITALSLAATNGSAAVVDALLKRGADANVAKATGESPLMTAARVGSMPVVERLIAARADVNAKEASHGQTALMWALAEGHPDVARVLVDRGADVNAPSSSGFTPLMFAARDGNIETSRVLMARGAAVNAVASDGSTALLAAVVRGHADLAAILLDAGADPNVDKIGYTALHWASGHWENITSFGKTWSEGREGREWRAMEGVPDKKIALINALLAHGANVNAPATKNPPRYGPYLIPPSVIGGTPLLMAATGADVNVMRLLVANGADPAAVTKDGITVLHAASGAGRWEVPSEFAITEQMAIAAIEFALELGNDINAVDHVGEMSVHHATGAAMPGVVRFLAAHGARIDIPDKYGVTPLGAALGRRATKGVTIIQERPELVPVLRQLGAVEEETPPQPVPEAPAARR